MHLKRELKNDYSRKNHSRRRFSNAAARALASRIRSSSGVTRKSSYSRFSEVFDTAVLSVFIVTFTPLSIKYRNGYSLAAPSLLQLLKQILKTMLSH